MVYTSPFLCSVSEQSHPASVYAINACSHSPLAPTSISPFYSGTSPFATPGSPSPLSTKVVPRFLANQTETHLSRPCVSFALLPDSFKEQSLRLFRFSPPSSLPLSATSLFFFLPTPFFEFPFFAHGLFNPEFSGCSVNFSWGIPWE